VTALKLTDPDQLVTCVGCDRLSEFRTFRQRRGYDRRETWKAFATLQKFFAQSNEENDGALSAKKASDVSYQASQVSSE
jgi:hypothetical protein